MKFFHYEPKHIYASLHDRRSIASYEQFAEAINPNSAYLSYEKQCAQAVEMCRATCESRFLMYRYSPWSKTIFVDRVTAEYLLSIMPPAWAKLGVVDLLY